MCSRYTLLIGYTYIHCIVRIGVGENKRIKYVFTRAVAVVGRMGIQFRPRNPEFFRGHLICSRKIIGFSSLLSSQV